ncbi:MAG: hypothetical protein P4L92_01435 [Rudaea sp.]|nr:hypothetical protein [Rudaea sp.]
MNAATTTDAGANTAPSACRRCASFSAEPALLEVAIPGLRMLGSAFSSVRGDDGICARHRRYIPAASTCADFAMRDR